jgi:deazaflavin-dependent oxidoreductase (nitroreductase family)
MATQTTSALPEIQPWLAVDDAVAMDRFNQLLIAEFRATGGRLSGQFTGAPILLLNTIGARSGLPRTTPLSYVRDGDAYVIMASKSGAPTNPAWYHNLLAHPTATVEVGDERFPVKPIVVEGEQRERLWERMVAQWPMAADYARATTRRIPLIVLERGGNA